ncbi:hypothetical protein GCM10018793_11840 [Streptomyces sulfonofaciens]|uniref:Uncharacterized protein n=1 Tax=Streptomyces sulfonofaciens TaxID=68272 RepID=A0A919FVZ7_9ACTN|nr:hypothetical protein [Streptomyces sulfonofaciens]GHH73310.1 hypothetical protein GCM10018793_11840 [Streptomyces sulfonofaciens]
MADHRRAGAEDRARDESRATDEAKGPERIPRDMPDQQSGGGKDRWDVPQERRDDGGRSDEELPDTDESGTGKRGDAARSGGVHPEHPVPDEPSA